MLDSKELGPEEGPIRFGPMAGPTRIGS